LQLRLLCSDAQLLEILPQSSPIELARHYCTQQNTDVIRRRVSASLRELRQLDVRIVTVADEDYPRRLQKLSEYRPPILFYRGDYGFVHRRMIAIVGTRRSTEYGNSVAEMLAGDFVRYDVGVISGLALGIDAQAHLGALAMGGRTVAVLGCGIDVPYPPRHARLQERIATEGLLLSEFAPGLPAMRHHFLQRNRLIALLAGGVVVVEANHKSGTSKTVEWAGNYGVTVFAVPGPIGREQSNGTNALIQDGAIMIVSVRDVLEELGWPAEPVVAACVQTTNPAPATGTAAEIYRVLSSVGMQIDAIARAARCETGAALALLAELELDGLVKQLPGKRFARVRVQENE
jgi:DNA processing protein